MKKTAQKNFRLSSDARKILREAVKKTGMKNETEIVEYCLGKWAREMNLEIDAATKLLLAALGNGIAAKGSSPQFRISSSQDSPDMTTQISSVRAAQNQIANETGTPPTALPNGRT